MWAVDFSSSDAAVQQLFAELKQLSRELLALVRLSSIIPHGPSLSISPLLARRLELFIARKGIDDAGALADFMANVIDCTHEEKLRILAAMSTKDRLERETDVLRVVASRDRVARKIRKGLAVNTARRPGTTQ